MAASFEQLVMESAAPTIVEGTKIAATFLALLLGGALFAAKFDSKKKHIRKTA